MSINKFKQTVLILFLFMLSVSSFAQEKQIKKIDKYLAKNDFLGALHFTDGLKGDVANMCYYYLANIYINQQDDYRVGLMYDRLKGYDPDSLIRDYYFTNAEKLLNTKPVDALNLYQKAGMYETGSRKVSEFFLNEKNYGRAISQLEGINAKGEEYVRIAEIAYNDGDNTVFRNIKEQAGDALLKSSIYAKVCMEWAKSNIDQAEYYLAYENTSKASSYFFYAKKDAENASKVYENRNDEVGMQESHELLERIDFMNKNMYKVIANKKYIKEIEEAITNNDQEFINALKPDDLNIFSEDGYTALHFAVRANNIKLVEKFLQMGADVNAQQKNSATAIHLAIANNNNSLAKYLLTKGASKYSYALYYGLPIDKAHSSKNKELLETLLPKNKNARVIHEYRLWRNHYFKNYHNKRALNETQAVLSYSEVFLKGKALVTLMSSKVNKQLVAEYNAIESAMPKNPEKMDYINTIFESIKTIDKIIVIYASKCMNKYELEALCYFNSGSTNASYLLEGIDQNLVNNNVTPVNIYEQLNYK